MQPEEMARLRSISSPLCVLSTVAADGKSESALVAYVLNDDCSILISTNVRTRKWDNIKQNPHISIVVGLAFGDLNMQYEGVAQLIDSGEEFNTAKTQFSQAHPELDKYRSNDTGFILVKPVWIRLVDYTAHPPSTKEYSF